MGPLSRGLINQNWRQGHTGDLGEPVAWKAVTADGVRRKNEAGKYRSREMGVSKGA